MLSLTALSACDEQHIAETYALRIFDNTHIACRSYLDLIDLFVAAITGGDNEDWSFRGSAAYQMPQNSQFRPAPP